MDTKNTKVGLTHRFTNCLPWRQSSPTFPSVSVEHCRLLLRLWSRDAALGRADPPDTSVVREPRHSYYTLISRYRVMQLCDNVTSVIDRWLAAVVKTDARLLATVRLSSLVSCSTRWYLRRARRESAATEITGPSAVNDSHSLLLCRLQLLHSLVIPVIHLLLQELAMVLHGLHLLCPALLLAGQLLPKCAEISR